VSTATTIGPATKEKALAVAQKRCFEELENESNRCLVVTWQAIYAAQPSNKLSALESGLNEWKKALCAQAIQHYETSVKLGNPDSESLLDTADRETKHVLSWFLRVSALDGGEEGRTGRVREFIWRAFTGNPEFSVYRPLKFKLPSLAGRRTLGERIAAPRIGQIAHAGKPVKNMLSVSQTDRFVKTAERRLLQGLHEALRIAEDEAFINAAANHSQLPGKPRGKLGGRTPSKQVARRRREILKAASTGATGERYCALLRPVLLQVPVEWQLEGCPKSYPDAWNDTNLVNREKWRQRISDEK
jgi:hypothetical protein